MKRRYALAGLLVAMSMFSSLAIVIADLPTPPPSLSYGNILRQRGTYDHGCPIFWRYQLPPLYPGPPYPKHYKTEDIDHIHFFFKTDSILVDVEITETYREDYFIEFTIDGSNMQDGVFADATYLYVKMEDGNWYYAVGPAPMWRRGG